MDSRKDGGTSMTMTRLHPFRRVLFKAIRLLTPTLPGL
ncbi:hypothetical protein VPHD81_0123 [Vibrio phage D81]